MDRVRRDSGETAPSFNAKLATYLQLHPEVVPPDPVKEIGEPTAAAELYGAHGRPNLLEPRRNNMKTQTTRPNGTDRKRLASATDQAPRRWLAGVLVAAAVCGSSAFAYAVCIQTTASQADMDLWNTHGCWQDFFLWQYRAYNMHQDAWSDRGWFDACNQNKEYPKHWTHPIW